MTCVAFLGACLTCLHVKLLISFSFCAGSWIFTRCYFINMMTFHLLDYFQISNLTPVFSNFPSSEYSTARFHFLSPHHEHRDRPLTLRGRANYRMCASNWKAAVELGNLWFSEWSFSKLRGKNATQYWSEEKKMAFFCLLKSSDKIRTALWPYNWLWNIS